MLEDGRIEKIIVKNKACECRESQGCGQDDRFKEDFENAILDLHNEWRDFVASGSDKKRPFLKQAANMQGIQWDKNLARLALCYVVRCKYEMYDRCRRTSKHKGLIGQNILYGSGESRPKTVLKTMERIWEEW